MSQPKHLVVTTKTFFGHKVLGHSNQGLFSVMDSAVIEKVIKGSRRNRTRNVIIIRKERRLSNKGKDEHKKESKIAK